MSSVLAVTITYRLGIKDVRAARETLIRRYVGGLGKRLPDEIHQATGNRVTLAGADIAVRSCRYMDGGEHAPELMVSLASEAGSPLPGVVGELSSAITQSFFVLAWYELNQLCKDAGDAGFRRMVVSSFLPARCECTVDVADGFMSNLQGVARIIEGMPRITQLDLPSPA